MKCTVPIGKRARVFLRLTQLLVFFLFFSSVSNLHVSANEATLSVKPVYSRVMGDDVEFQVNLTVTEVTNLYGWQAKLYYDPTLLNGTTIVEGPFLKAGGDTYFSASLDDNYNFTHGRANLMCTLLREVPGLPGNGTLATLTFKTKTLGTCLLILSETKLGDPQGTPILHSISNAGVEVIPPIRDVAVKNVALSRDEVGEGRSVDVLVSVANEGAKTESFTVNIYANDTLIGTLDVSSLARDSQQTLTYHWNTTGLAIGNSYQVRAEASPVPEETETGDNVFIDGFLKITQGKHDVAAKRLTLQYTVVYEGRKLNITVAVANRGDFTETFDVKTYYDDFLLGTKTVVDLPYGAEQNVVFTWDTTGVGSNRSYTMKATASQVAGETYTADNTLVDGSVTIVPRPLRTIDIAAVTPSDQFGRTVSSFTRGSVAYFKVTVDCSSFTPEFVLLTVNVYDAQSLSIAIVSFGGLIAPGSTTFVLGSVIPSTSNLGAGSVYANALSDWPHLGGSPYCPERSATFQIVGA